MENLIEVALNKEEMPLRTLLDLIDSGLIKDEIPFDIIAKEYPDLLEEWYPGFPGMPRATTEDDPFCVDGIIQGEYVMVQDIPGLDRLHMSANMEKELGAGKCKVWIQRDGGEWIVTLQKDKEV